jgi:hypothetical protein
VSAIGVGVAKPPAHVHKAIYLAVRLDDRQLADRTLLGEIDALGATVVVDAQTAQRHPHAIDWLATEGVDIANGGWGKGTLLPWNQARDDLSKAGKVLAHEAGAPPVEFVSARRPDAFDQFYSRRAKQRIVHPNTIHPEGLPRTLEARKVYLLDGRDRDPKAMEVAVSDLTIRIEKSGLPLHPFGELR